MAVTAKLQQGTGPAPRLRHGIRPRYRWIVIGGGGTLTALMAVSAVGAMSGRGPRPDSLPWTVWVHLLTVVPALWIGMWLMLNPKRGLHKPLGIAFSILMLTTAMVSFGIMRSGRFSFVHVFSVATLALVPLAWLAASQREFRSHSRRMRGYFFGALITAGLATYVPGRIMWRWAFG
ncbi:MAG: hypothetical protein RQ833_03765 [Sphingomonadaceae bacterium]|nr:hypothetical protein [Sphingomonadaceae bacterium]